MVVDFQQKTRHRTTVQSLSMELGGIEAATTQTLMENTSKDLTSHMLMVLFGIIGKDINTP